MKKYRTSLEKLRVPKKFGFFDFLALAALICLLAYALTVSNTIDLGVKFNEPSPRFFTENVSSCIEEIPVDSSALSYNAAM